MSYFTYLTDKCPNRTRMRRAQFQLHLATAKLKACDIDITERGIEYLTMKWQKLWMEDMQKLGVGTYIRIQTKAK